MINIKDNTTEKEYTLKNRADEFSIKELEIITSIMYDDKLGFYEKYLDIFEYLGLGELMENIDDESFNNLISEFDMLDIDNEYINTVEIDGYTYSVKMKEDGTPLITGKDMALIESYIKTNSEKYMGELIAILFKRDDLSNKEHYDNTHIKHKAKLFYDNVKADVVIPFVVLISHKIIKSLEQIKNRK